MKIRCSVLSFIIVLICSCGGKSDVDYESIAASEAAKQYYTYLVEGNSTEFVKSFAREDALPPDYIKSFYNNTKDFLDVQKERHGGICGVEISSAERDSVLKTINVFLTLSYGDSTKSKVVVPMIKYNNKWLMK